MPVIALTGATGFVGQVAVSRLQQRFPQTRLRVLIRTPDQRTLPPAFSECEIVAGDLEQPDALDQLVRGIDCIIHVAAAIAGNRAGDFDRPTSPARVDWLKRSAARHRRLT